MSTAGQFSPHRSLDHAAQIRHVESFLTRLAADVVALSRPKAAAKNTGNGARVATTLSGGGGGGGGSSIAVLSGDVTGPSSANVAGQASGSFSVLGGDLTVTAGRLLAVFTDAATNSSTTVASITHHSTGTTAAGFGSELDFINQNSSGADAVCGWLQGLYTGGVTGAENGAIVLGGIYSGVRFEGIRIRGGAGMAVLGGVGGQTLIRNDIFATGNSIGVFSTTPVGQQAGASAAGIVAIADSAAKTAITALQNALHAYGWVTAPP